MDRLVTGDDGNDNNDDDDDDDEDDGDNDDGGDENDDDDDHDDDDDVGVMMVVVNKICIFSIVCYSRTPVTRTLMGNEKKFELLRNSSYQSKFQWNWDQGKGNLIRVIEVLLYMYSSFMY